mmetsp:Transcript_11611/g.14061  ORF Transcript_11611/g.14061 Transcript_11611/m.14061 type:complete len:206 (-) Transcript_11611:79-696(-)
MRVTAAIILHQSLSIIISFLNRTDDPVHDRHSRRRMTPDRSFRRQHDGINPLINSRRDVARFSTGRRRILDHAFKHLSGDDDRLGGIARHSDNFSLDQRHFFRREFDTKVAAGDHHRICSVDYGVQIINRCWLLELRHNHRLITDQTARFFDICNGLDEGQRNNIYTHIKRKRQVAAVLFRQSGHGQRLAANGEAFAILQHTRQF